MKEYEVNSPVLGEPWTGQLEDILEENPELPELVRRRLEALDVGETIRPPVGPDVFEITRIA